MKTGAEKIGSIGTLKIADMFDISIVRHLDA